MKIFETTLLKIAQNQNVRLDFRFHSYQSKAIPFLHCSFGKIITTINNGEDISKNHYVYGESDLIYPTVNNLKKVGFDFSNLTYLDENTKTNKLIKDGDLLMSRSGTVGLSQVWDSKKIEQILGKSVEAIPSGYLIVVGLNSATVNSKFAQYYLNSSLMEEYFYVFGVGKSQKNISQSDILNIPFPIIEKTIQDEAIERVEPIEREIENLQAQIGAPTEPINRVFAREFGFDIERFEELKQQKTFSLTLEDFSANQDLRFSAKFHRPAAKFVESQLRGITDKSIIDFLAEDIVLGASVSPDDYDDNGEFYYVAMSSIKSWSFEEDNSRLVSDAYSERNKSKSVNESDIIIARSGEGTIGKVALIEDDVKGIFADFTMRIRLKDYNAKFAYYYFRTEYFQYLIETHKKGLGNNTNIFPVQIKEFPMPDISPEKQIEILDEINEEFSAQDEIKRQIE
ncbi:MAG TPA: restriction endonuclease subunit S, partial [Pyrinomonadaceae bacterium]